MPVRKLYTLDRLAKVASCIVTMQVFGADARYWGRRQTTNMRSSCLTTSAALPDGEGQMFHVSSG